MAAIIAAMLAVPVLAAYPGPDNTVIVGQFDPYYPQYNDYVLCQCEGFYQTGIQNTYYQLYYYGSRSVGTEGNVVFTQEMWLDWQVGSQDMQGYVPQNTYYSTVTQTVSFGSATTISDFNDGVNWWYYGVVEQAQAS